MIVIYVMFTWLFLNKKWRKSKNPDLLRSGFYMVEARGFEPLSEDHATQASTGVVTVLMSPKQTPRNRLSLRSA